LATIHGDEAQGTPTALKLAEHLQNNPQVLTGKKVIILPQANPDGVILKQRFNAHGIDLNRNFPAKNRENSPKYGFKALCEPESKIIYKIIKKYKPQIIVSLHQPAGQKPGWIDYDGDAKELAEKMASACGMPVYKYGSMPGSLGSYASQKLNTPIITFELPRDANATAEILWQKYGNALLTALSLP
jgi:murein peptide amidase A